jgi:hypothetical protein
MGPPWPCSSRSGSRYSMSRTCGPRDIIFLVIPKMGDNTRNNPTTTMGDPLSTCNFINVQGYPHLVPNKDVEKLPAFQGNNVVSARSHITNVNMCILKWCSGHDHEDVKMKLFVYSLEGEALEWFIEQYDNKFSTLA